MAEATKGNKIISMPTDFVELGKKQVQHWAAAQSDIVELILATNKGWGSRIASHIAAGSEFANELSSVRSMPELAAFWHEWAIMQCKATVDDTKQALSEGQKLAETATRFFANNWAKP